MSLLGQEKACHRPLTMITVRPCVLLLTCDRFEPLGPHSYGDTRWGFVVHDAGEDILLAGIARASCDLVSSFATDAAVALAGVNLILQFHSVLINQSHLKIYSVQDFDRLLRRVQVDYWACLAALRREQGSSNRVQPGRS